MDKKEVVLIDYLDGDGSVAGIDNEELERLWRIVSVDHAKVEVLLRAEEERLTSHFQTNGQHQRAVRMGRVIGSYSVSRERKSFLWFIKKKEFDRKRAQRCAKTKCCSSSIDCLILLPYEGRDIDGFHGQKIHFGDGPALMRRNEPPVQRIAALPLAAHGHFQMEVATASKHLQDLMKHSAKGKKRRVLVGRIDIGCRMEGYFEVTCRADAKGLYRWIRGEKVVLTGIRTLTKGFAWNGFGMPLA